MGLDAGYVMKYVKHHHPLYERKNHHLLYHCLHCPFFGLEHQ